MIKCFNSLFLMIFFPLLTLLTGCNSEGVFSSQPQPPIDATVIEITVSPSPILVVKGRTQQLVAVAKYDNGTESDVSDSVTWEIVGDPTIADISASALLTGNVTGDTELIASKDGITSDTVNVNVCNWAGPCIDIFDTGSGKLFTSSPSVVYLDSIGGSAADSTYRENGTYGPTGDFYLFNWNNANALCTTYNTHSLGGRTNWRLATRDELKTELYDAFSYMDWPRSVIYWSATPNGSYYYSVHLAISYVDSYSPSDTHYASCVSNP